MSPNKVDLNIAEPEIRTSRQSKRKIMGSVRFLKAGVALSFLQLISRGPSTAEDVMCPEHTLSFPVRKSAAAL